MKCKICGHRTTSLPAMSAHYRKKHKGKMKRGAQRKSKKYSETREAYYTDAHQRVEDALIAFAERYNRGR